MISHNLVVRLFLLLPALKSEVILGLMRSSETGIEVFINFDGKQHDRLISNEGMSLSEIFSNFFKTLIIIRILLALHLKVLEHLVQQVQKLIT